MNHAEAASVNKTQRVTTILVSMSTFTLQSLWSLLCARCMRVCQLVASLSHMVQCGFLILVIVITMSITYVYVNVIISLIIIITVGVRLCLYLLPCVQLFVLLVEYWGVSIWVRERAYVRSGWVGTWKMEDRRHVSSYRPFCLGQGLGHPCLSILVTWPVFRVNAR